MTERDRVAALLEREANRAGAFVPPPMETFERRTDRRTRTRALLAVACTVFVVAGVAIGVALTRGRSTPSAPHPFSLSSLPAPAGPHVGADRLRSYRWSKLPPAPIHARTGAASVWTGSQLIVWGGGTHSAMFSDGAAYDPTTREWTKLPPSPLTPRWGAVSAWVDGSFVIWGGTNHAAHAFTDGAGYDPANRTWSRLPTSPIRPTDWVTSAIAGNRLVLLYGGSPVSSVLHAVAYDVATDQWVPLPSLRLARTHDVRDATALGIGDTVLVWAYWSHVAPTGPNSTYTTFGTAPYALALSRPTWEPSALSTPKGFGAGTPIWTGHSLILAREQSSCYGCAVVAGETHSVVIDSANGRRTMMANTEIPQFGDIVWTGDAVLSLNAAGETSGIWDPETNSWTPLTTPRFADDDTVVWTGQSVLVWGASRSGSVGYEFGP